MKSEDIVANPRWLFYTFIPTILGFFILFKKLDKSRQTKFSWKDKVVLITGACKKGGLGYALAVTCIQRGVKRLILTGREEADFLVAVNDLRTFSSAVQIDTFQLDLTSSTEVINQTVDRIHQSCGSIDVLINNAGCSYRGSIEKTRIEVFRQLIECNFMGHVAITQNVLQHRLSTTTQQDSSPLVIVGISSLQGLVSLPYRSAYAASKHAFHAYHECLSYECAAAPLRNRVRVLLVSPSYIRTQLSLHAIRDSGERHALMDETTSSGMLPESAAEEITRAVEMGRSDLRLTSSFSQSCAPALSAVVPALYAYIMRKKAMKEVPY